MNLVIVAVFSFLSLAKADERCCPNTGCFSDNFPFSHLPLPRCEDYIQPEFLVYTRSNRNSPASMTRNSVPGILATSKRTLFLIHGYNGGRDSTWTEKMKDALLEKGDYNVVKVAWGDGAQTLWYPQAASNTRVVGAETAAVTQNLLNRGLARRNLICIGHSLGAHTCGHAGERTRFGRISGLDPAGPLFENYPTEARLNPSDADFVDVIHTMGKEGFILDFGTLAPLGHVDFYPNGGGIQPGCSNKDYEETYGDIVGCSHARSAELYRQSIFNPCFSVRQRCTDVSNLPGSCYDCGEVCQTMGYMADAYRNKPDGLFYSTTTSSAPFCQN